MQIVKLYMCLGWSKTYQVNTLLLLLVVVV